MRVFLLFIFLSVIINAKDLEINILYLEEKIKKPAVLSNIIKQAEDSGIKGASLAVKDSNLGSRFLNINYKLEKIISQDKILLLKKLNVYINNNGSYVLLNVQDELFKQIISKKEYKNILFINVGNKSSSLRINICQNNVIHTIASNAMLYDALTQFLVKRNWKKWLLISGVKKEDLKIVEAIKRSQKRFNTKIVEEKTWESTSDIRRKAQDELPSFTQSKDYDVTIVADYYGDFGEYIYFNTWLPRPLAGTQGLRPVTWHKVIESWGAAQLQKRFEKHAKRWMNSYDYSSYTAIRTIVRAINESKDNNALKNINFIRSSSFDLGAYKGRKLSFREFNGQLRQPISLIHPKALVSTSPQNGFLHEISDLDTLGISKYELKCKK